MGKKRNKREVLKLRRNHGWKAKPGHRIFVADQGAVRFDFPQDWILDFSGKKGDSVKIYDGKPPNDDCRLEVSVWYLAPLDWSGLPLSKLVREVVEGDERDIIKKGSMQEEVRGDLEIAWTEFLFIDHPNQHRKSYSRVCMARRGTIQPLITMDFWPEDELRVGQVWDTVLETLELGNYIQDPTLGPPA